jgi:hypothetical protein
MSFKNLGKHRSEDCTYTFFASDVQLAVLIFVRGATQIAPVAALCLERIAAMLLLVCQNPTQPGFNHYLFESVAALIRYSAAADISKVADLEKNLFPAFNVVLQQDVQASTLPTLSTMKCPPRDTAAADQLHAVSDLS